MSEKDSAQSALRSLPIKAGNAFTHYKRGGVYEIITLALQEDTLEPLVVYRSVNEGTVWVRTYKNFTEDVEHEGGKIRRFVKKQKRPREVF